MQDCVCTWTSPRRSAAASSRTPGVADGSPADALVRALLVLGTTSRDVGRVMGGEGKKHRRRAA